MGATSNSNAGPNAESTSTREVDLESEFDAESEDESSSDRDADANEEESKTLFDRLDTAATIIWAAFLAVVVILALIPAAAVLAGVAPFTPVETLPYVAFVGAVVVGTIAIIGTALWDA